MDNDEDEYFSDGEKGSFGEEEDVFGEENDDVEDAFEDGHLGALIRMANEGNKVRKFFTLVGLTIIL